MNHIELDYETLRKQGTGNYDEEEKKIVEIPFDKYVIKVLLTPTNKFLGIVEISINKDFLTHAQRLAVLASTGYHDVEKYYTEEE